MIRIVKQQLDAVAKLEYVTLADDYGHKHQVVLSLLADQDHDAVLEQEKALLQTNQEAFECAARKRGYDDAHLAALKRCCDDCPDGKPCKDC